MAVHDSCVQEYLALKTSRKYKYVFFKIQDDPKMIVVDKTGAAGASYDDFYNEIKAFPTNECRYAVFDYEWDLPNNGGKRQKIIFIAWYVVWGRGLDGGRGVEEGGGEGEGNGGRGQGQGTRVAAHCAHSLVPSISICAPRPVHFSFVPLFSRAFVPFSRSFAPVFKSSFMAVSFCLPFALPPIFRSLARSLTVHPARPLLVPAPPSFVLAWLTSLTPRSRWPRISQGPRHGEH